MKITITHDDGTTTEVERIDVRDGDIFQIKGNPSYEQVEQLLDHLCQTASEKRVLLYCGDNFHLLTREERLALIEQLRSEDACQ